MQLRGEFDQQRGLHRAVDDQAGITFDLGDVVAVVMDAVAVEGQRRVAKQQHRIGHMAFAMLGGQRRRRRLGGRGVLAIRRHVAIDDVLPLADGEAARRGDDVVDRDEAQRARAAGLHRHVRDGRRARHLVADAQRFDESRFRRPPTSGAAAAPAAGNRRASDGRRGQAATSAQPAAPGTSASVNGAASPVFGRRRYRETASRADPPPAAR